MRELIVTKNDIPKSLSEEKKELWNSLKIRRATQPNDVIWKNYGLSQNKKLYRRIITVCSAVALIAACFGAVTGLSYAKNYFTNDD